ncbi:TetR family transcriptional regulator, partial [Streptomyces chartreusis]
MTGSLERRAAPVDAGAEVLARQGVRALTFRAVDPEAGPPVGTASSYFTGRDDLLRQIDTRLPVRLAPDPDVIAELSRGLTSDGRSRAGSRVVAGQPRGLTGGGRSAPRAHRWRSISPADSPVVA